MKKPFRLAFFLFPLLLLFCQGCGHRTSAMPTDNAYHLETDYQDSYKGANAVFYFTDTPEGTVYKGMSRLYMVSDNDAALQLCCAKPECQHSWYSDICTAALPSAEEGLQYMNGKLYYADLFGNTGKLCRMDITGENREVLLEAPVGLLNSNNSLVFHRGFLYLYSMEGRSESSTALKLYQLDLENPSSEMKLLWEGVTPGMSMCLVSNLTARGNYLFFRDPNFHLYMDKETTPSLLHSMDLQTGQIYDCILPDGELPTGFAIVDDRVFVSVLTNEGYRLTSFSYTFEEPVEFSEGLQQERLYLCGDPQYLYLWQWKSPTLYILDRNGQQLDTVDISFFQTDFCYATLQASMREDGRVYITNGGMNFGFHYFEKSEIGSGQIQLTGLPLVSSFDMYFDPIPMPDDFDWDWYSIHEGDMLGMIEDS